MAELKTKLSDASVEAFLDGIADERKRQDSYAILAMMQEVTGVEAKMWGDSIVGFGTYHYKYASGREADWMLVGFSPRKQNLTLYIMSGFEQYDRTAERIGQAQHGQVCLYIQKLQTSTLRRSRSWFASP